MSAKTALAAAGRAAELVGAKKTVGALTGTSPGREEVACLVDPRRTSLDSKPANAEGLDLLVGLTPARNREIPQEAGQGSGTGRDQRWSGSESWGQTAAVVD